MLQAFHDAKLMWLLGGIVSLLLISSIIGNILKTLRKTDASRATIDNLNARIRAWWKMCLIFGFSLLVGPIGSLILFGIISFQAMREYMTLVPTRRGDHRTLFWSFFAIMPLQYYLIGTQWYGFFAIMIPVFAFVFVPTRIALSGEIELGQLLIPESCCCIVDRGEVPGGNLLPHILLCLLRADKRDADLCLDNLIRFRAEVERCPNWRISFDGRIFG